MTHTITKKIDELRAADYNPRLIQDQDFEALKRSIKEFGFVEPVVVNMAPGRENVIIGGHMRVEAAKRVGLTEVPVMTVYLPINKEKELNLALNRISGEWDDVKLGEVLQELEASGEPELTGFSPAEIDKLLHRDTDLEELTEKLSTADGDSLGISHSKQVKCPGCGILFEATL